MKKQLLSVLFVLLGALTVWAQAPSALDQLKADPKKAYGTDYPYLFQDAAMTRAPRGYKPFYISHYARHGSRYYWNETLYRNLDTLLDAASRKNLFTPEGQAFYERFLELRPELMTGISELTQVGWDQHQRIARTMYNRFPEVFRKGGNVLAISSLSGRCMLSMSAFCQELVQCNPAIEIREQASRFTLDGVVPQDKQNPVKHQFPKASPRFIANMEGFPRDTLLYRNVISRVFTSTEGLPGNIRRIADDLVSLYTSLPSISHEGMMDGLVTDQELVDHWETSNLDAYIWVYSDQYQMIPILEDFIKKADDVLEGRSDRVADLRFGHDSCIGPLTVLMGLGGADRDPEDPGEVKECYRNWETCKAANIQLVFFRSRKASDPVLVKCLLNGEEVSLPVQTDCYPFYRWDLLRAFYLERCQSVQ